MRFEAGGVKNDSPIGPIYLDRKAKAAHLLWLSRIIEASGLDLTDVCAVDGDRCFAFIERGLMKVRLPDA